MSKPGKYILIDESLWSELQERAAERGLRGGSQLVAQYLGRFISDTTRNRHDHGKNPVTLWDDAVFGVSRKIRLHDAYWQWLDQKCNELEVPRHLLVNGILQSVMRLYSGKAGYRPVRII